MKKKNEKNTNSQQKQDETETETETETKTTSKKNKNLRLVQIGAMIKFKMYKFPRSYARFSLLSKSTLIDFKHSLWFCSAPSKRKAPVDISSPTPTPTTSENSKQDDYYAFYGSKFYSSAYQKMMKDVEKSDEYKIVPSFIKEYESTQRNTLNKTISTVAVSKPGSILKVEIRIKSENLRDKKRLRLDSYLFDQMQFAVFHRNFKDKVGKKTKNRATRVTDSDNDNNINNSSDSDSKNGNTFEKGDFDLRFRLFDKKARKEAKYTLRRARMIEFEENEIESEALLSPLTLTKMRVSRTFIKEFINNEGIIINDDIKTFKGSYKCKQDDIITLYVTYDTLLQQYHRRIMQLFSITMKERFKQQQQQEMADNANNDDDEDNDDNSDEDSDDGDSDEEEHVASNVSDNESSIHSSRAITPILEAYDIESSLNDQESSNVSAQHICEWLELIKSQIMACEYLISNDEKYYSNDVILYEDESIIVINKPPNISVHPSFNTGLDFSNCLINFLLYHCPKLKNIQSNAITAFRDQVTLATAMETIQNENIKNYDSNDDYGEKEHFEAKLINPMTQYNDIIATLSTIKDKYDIDDSSIHHTTTTTTATTVNNYNSPLADVIKPGIVHRLDKRTSGLMVVGKTKHVCNQLIEQFASNSSSNVYNNTLNKSRMQQSGGAGAGGGNAKQSTMKREYLALVHNRLEKPILTVKNYLERHPISRTRFRVMDTTDRSPISILTRDEVEVENKIRSKLGQMSFEEEQGLLIQHRDDTLKRNLLNDSASGSGFGSGFGSGSGSGDIDSSMLSLDNDEYGIMNDASFGSARLAITHFKELETFGFVPNKQRKTHYISLVNCRLSTGRTHQIRVHCEDLKIPILNDHTYCIHEYHKYEKELFGKYGNEVISGFDEMHYLHAYLLEFIHPKTGKRGQFTAHPPKFFTKTLGRLRTLAQLNNLHTKQ